MISPHVEVLLCRGCCCGTARKHPDTDHQQQERILAAAGSRCPTARVRTVGCLGPCSYSNVVVIRPIGSSGERTWLGRINTLAQTLSLSAWIEAGADLDSLPAQPALDRFVPDLAIRQQAAKRAAS